MKVFSYREFVQSPIDYLFRRHREGMVRIAISIVQDFDLGEDVVMNVFRQLQEYYLKTGKVSYRMLKLMVVRNAVCVLRGEWVDGFGARWPVASLDELEAGSDTRGEHPWRWQKDWRERQEAVLFRWDFERFMSKQTNLAREAVGLRFFADLEWDEVARLLGVERAVALNACNDALRRYRATCVVCSCGNVRVPFDGSAATRTTPSRKGLNVPCYCALPEGHRDIVRLHVEEGLSGNAISLRLGRQRGTVNQVIRRWVVNVE